jgi:hypothetical protein
MAKQILSEEFRRMQKLAGIITEEQLNENIEQFEDYISGMWDASISDEMEEGEYFEDVWEKEQYGDEEEYDTEEWYGLTDYLKSVGGKATLEGNPDIDLELMPNGDIKFGATVTLDESLNEKQMGSDYSVKLLVPKVYFNVETGELSGNKYEWYSERELRAGADQTSYTDAKELDTVVFSNDYSTAMDFASEYPELLKVV